MRKTLYPFLLITTFVLCLTQCYRDKGKPSINYIVHPSVDSFNMLSREEQVRKCGSCHAKEFENEKRGPHSNAMKMLHAHIHNDWSGIPEYGKYLNKIYSNNACKSCHALPNLYETEFLAPNKNKDSLAKYINELMVPKPTGRDKESALITGVDCLTCHYDGKRVITNNTIKRHINSNCPSYCNPKGSDLFSSNNNCVSCHKDEVVSMAKLPNAITKEMDCLKCHQEYDKNGNPTHYIYWQFNYKEKPKPNHLNVFEDITAHYDTVNKNVIVEWNNRRLPHSLTICTETIASYEITDGRGVEKGRGQIRLNRKKEQDTVLKRYWGNKPVQGVIGYSIPLDGSVLRDTISNIKTFPGNTLQIKITGGHKEQYWLHDSTQLITFRKTLKLL